MPRPGPRVSSGRLGSGRSARELSDVCRVGAHRLGGGDVEGWATLAMPRKGLDQAGEQLRVHGASRYVRFERADEEAFIEALERTADLPMTLLDLEEGTRWEDLWPSTEHIGLPVLLPGGEVGNPLRFERSGGDVFTWALESRRSVFRSGT